MKTTESDYVGKSFGQLTVIRRVDSKVREAKWFCLCSCGGNTIVASSKIKRGHPSNFVDLTGCKYGALTIFKRIENDSRNRAQWLVGCDCGNEITLTSGQVKNQKNCRQCYSGVLHTDSDRKCYKCGHWKLLNQFPLNKKSKSGRHSYCYVCFKEYRRQWVRKHFYGLSEEDFNKAFEESNGACGMCGRHEDLVIDHCHRTGKFRGLICRLCNGILGRFKDNTDLLQRAIEYLNKHIDESVLRSA
jgi:hypothetical protein